MTAIANSTMTAALAKAVAASAAKNQGAENALVNYIAAQVAVEPEAVSAPNDEIAPAPAIESGSAPQPQFTANGSPIHPDGMLPKAQYIAWLQETGRYVPLTDAQKAERATARAIKKAVKDAKAGQVSTAEAAPARKPTSEAQRKFFAGYYARQRAGNAIAA